MKRIFLLLFYMFVYSLSSVAQQYMNIRMNAKLDTFMVRKYMIEIPKDTSEHILIAKFNFNGTEILNKKDLKKLNDGFTQVLAIDYVYTQHPDIEAQSYINQKRFVELGLVAPFVMDQKMINWNAYQQLGFTDPSDAAKLLHAFVIRYRKIENLDLSNPVVTKKMVKKRMQKPVDSTVYNVFKRNPNMNKSVVVVDLTCSMNPYVIEVASWFCLNDFKKGAAYFAFFNDGDGKANDKKVIGKTGGIHSFKTNNLDTIVQYMERAVSFGCSGDEPENDIEAVLKAQSDNPNCEEIILIADNWSDMRDYGLRTKITKPVRVILCGTQSGVNPQYLTLARATKGSVHTLDEDLGELFKMKEGHKFQMFGNEYQVFGGQIQLIGRIKK